MSEEQPVFKVTDRRLFNPDGTPREIEREEETKTETVAAETKQSAPASEPRAAAASQAGEAARESAQRAPAAASPVLTTPGDADVAGATDTTAANSARAGAAEQFAEDDY